MVRAKSSKRSKELAVIVANIITTKPTVLRSQTKDTVARHGPLSVFGVFSQICPKMIRENRRDGITEAEFNKALEKDGFVRVRMRTTAKQHKANIFANQSYY
eukprot:3140910-Rhodomonas_salina.2